MSKNIARSSRWSFSIIIFYIATKRNRTGSRSFWKGGLKLLLNQPALPPPLPPARPQEQIRKLNGYIRSCWCKNIGIRQLVKKNLYADDRALPLVRTTEGNSTDQICEKYRRVHLPSIRKASEIVSLTRRPIDTHTLTASIMITFTITFSLSFSSLYNSSAIARLVSLKLEKKQQKNRDVFGIEDTNFLEYSEKTSRKEKSLKNTIQLKLPNNF